MKNCYGIIMRGISESSLHWKDESGLEGLPEHHKTWDIFVKLPNNKKVLLNFEASEEENYLGYLANYPWEEYSKNITKEDVDNALVKILLPYVTDTEEYIRNAIEYINTYNSY